MEDEKIISEGTTTSTSLEAESESATMTLLVESESEPMATSEERTEPRKRGIEEELQPVLLRLPSETPSCSSDRIRVSKDQFRIGRKPDNDEVILSVWISRNHCILQYDKSSDNWLVTNLSSTDTLLNERPIVRNKTETIKEGDVLQLSLSDSFKYKFTLIKKEHESVKHPRLETNDCELGTVLDKQKSFVAWQENERKDLEKQLSNKQLEQEKLKVELDKLLQDQKLTKTCNEELNNQIADLQKKIEVGNSSELELQQKYRDLLEKLEEERLKFEEKLAAEKQKWQEVLKETKQEKEKLEMSMVEQMEEWREKVEKKQQEEWQKRIDNLLVEEKSVQSKLQDEKQLLEQKLKEMEATLKQREQAALQQQHTQPVDMTKCIIVEIGNANHQSNLDHIPILETIDLTSDLDTRHHRHTTTTSSSSKFKSFQDEAVIDKVNNIMDEQLTCSICSELFVRAMTLNCTHTFCRHCIDCWIKKRRECPNCRATIVSMTRSLVVDNFIEKMLESLTPEQMQKRKQLIEERRILSMINNKKKTVKKR